MTTTRPEEHPMDTEPTGIRLSFGEYAATEAKIAKINARAAKRGFTGRITLDAEQVTRTTTNDFGFAITETYYVATIGGEAPKYNGYTLLATLDFDPEAGLIVRTAPGVEKVNRDNLVRGWCDHCRTTRARTKTYLVGDEHGAQVQVGSTCIKDFLGWTGSFSFIDADAVRDDVEEFLSNGTYRDNAWPVETVLAASWAAIKAYGFRPASSYDGTPTKNVVLAILDPRSKWDRAEAAELAPYVQESYAQAALVRAWVLSDGFTGDNEYVHNLKAIAAAAYVTSRNLGFLASAPQAWAKTQARDLVRKVEAEELVNEFVGTVGDKLDIEATVKFVTYIQGDYGTTSLYTLAATDGHIFKWFASKSALGDAGTGTLFTLRGTVKDHSEYNGVKATVLTRCKVLSEAAAE